MRKLFRNWILFALCVFLLANLMALALVFLKMPMLSDALPVSGWFPRVLVFHVDLSIVVWGLSMVSLMWLFHLPSKRAWLDRLALGLLFGAGVGLLSSILLGQGRPLLSNYIPILDAPLYLASLGTFVAAVALVAVPRVSQLSLRVGVDSLPQAAFGLSLLAFLVTVAVQLVAWWRLSPLPLNLQQAELLFWGAGHSLQAVYLCSLLGGWFYLLQPNSARAHLLQRTSYRIGLLLMLPVIAAPLMIAVAWSPDTSQYREAFSIWMRLFSLPILGLMLLLAWSMLSANGIRSRLIIDGRLLAVGLSMVLFLLGVVIGAMIRGDSLLVPAHYHATTGAVNLIFMALICDFFGLLRRGKGVQRQLKTYAAGVVLMVMGLAISGWMGVGRKLAASDQVFGSSGEMAAMLLMGCGGAVGLIASFWFIGRALPSLCRSAGSLGYSSGREVVG
ncbi:MAG: hypothetical protein V7752_06790 [Halopseudomonas sp.]